VGKIVRHGACLPHDRAVCRIRYPRPITELDIPTDDKKAAAVGTLARTSVPLRNPSRIGNGLALTIPHQSERRETMNTLIVVLLTFLWVANVQPQAAWGSEAKGQESKTAAAAKQKPDRRESMKKFVLGLLMFVSGMEQTRAAWGSEFKAREAKIAQYKRWLDTLGPEGSQYWVRLDSGKRPHRLYLGEAFHRADRQSQERFIDTYSSYLAGHPEKFMLIDLFDSETNKWIGEYGFGGFKLYAKPAPTSDTVQTSRR
jgi:hypothetical protein